MKSQNVKINGCVFKVTGVMPKKFPAFILDLPLYIPVNIKGYCITKLSGDSKTERYLEYMEEQKRKKFLFSYSEELTLRDTNFIPAEQNI